MKIHAKAAVRADAVGLKITEPSQGSLLPWIKCLPFISFHIATVILAYMAGVSWEGVAICGVSYVVRMFGITAGYHRYFSHRSFETSRVFQFILALLGTLALQKGVLWWASHHRQHHASSDMPEDPHSRLQHGFWYAHVGWFMSNKYRNTDWDRIHDFTKFWELRALNTVVGWLTPFVLMCMAIYLTMGFQALVWGCFISTVLLYHATFTINSLMHSWGKQVYNTRDESRNSLLLALLTGGEGWHNNHHHCPSITKQGFAGWKQFDLTYYILWCLRCLGIVWRFKKASRQTISGHPRKGVCRLAICEIHSSETE